MAEAFGLAAGVLQVASFGAEVGSALWTCAKKIRHADKELRDLAGQVEATSRCLRGVGSLLDDPDTKASHTSKLYDDTRAVSKGCHEVIFELDRAVKKIDNGKTKISVVQRLQWPLNSDKLTEPLKILKNYNDVLHLMLTVLQIVEGRRAATSEELLVLGKSLQRLTISNESLSQSNKALTDILTSQNQGAVNSNSGFAVSNPAASVCHPDAPMTSPFISFSAISAPPPPPPSTPPKDHLIQRQNTTGYDATHDHLQRCMDSVQELANTIACAMSAWQGGERNGSSDIHGSHAKVLAELGELPPELECQKCSGRVSWADFDLTKAASASLGSCMCSGRTSSSLWIPYIRRRCKEEEDLEEERKRLRIERQDYCGERGVASFKIRVERDGKRKIRNTSSPKDHFPSSDQNEPSKVDIRDRARQERPIVRQDYILSDLGSASSNTQGCNITRHEDHDIAERVYSEESRSSGEGSEHSTDEGHGEKQAQASRLTLSESVSTKPKRSPPIVPPKPKAFRDRIATFNQPTQPQGQDCEPLSDGLGLGHFSLNDGHHATQNFYSPGHSPYISPRLMHQQSELPAFTADNNFGMGPAMSGQFNPSDYGLEEFPSYGQDSFPTYNNQRNSPSDLEAADQMSPPEISIDYAPPRYSSKRPFIPPPPKRSAYATPDIKQMPQQRYRCESKDSFDDEEGDEESYTAARPPAMRRPALGTPRGRNGDIDIQQDITKEDDKGEQEEGKEEEDSMDEETVKREVLRQRMAKMSGGMGMAGMFGAPGGVPVPGERAYKKPTEQDSSIDQERRQLDLTQRIAELEIVMAKGNKLGTSGDEFEAEASAIHPIDLLLNAGADCSVSISDSEIDNDADSDGSLYLQEDKISSPDLGARDNAVKPSSAVQALLSRWLGDNANTVYLAKQN